MIRRVLAGTLTVLSLGVGLGTATGTVSAPSVIAEATAGFPVEKFLAHWWVFPASVAFSLVALATVGGFVTGLISAGLPEIVTTQLVVRCRVPPRVAVATSVFVLAIAAVAGAVVHALAATPVWYVVAWSIAGVILGGTVGSRVGKYVPSEAMEKGLGVVFVLVAIVVLVTTFL